MHEMPAFPAIAAQRLRCDTKATIGNRSNNSAVSGVARLKNINTINHPFK